MGLISKEALVSDFICMHMYVCVQERAGVSKGAKSWKRIKIKSQDHYRNNGASGPDIWSQRTFRSFPASSHLVGKLAK